MICTSCQKAEAVVFVKTIVNNEVSQAAYCASCASQGQSLAPADALLELLSGGGPPRARTHPARCPACQTSYADFKRSGRLGCPECYDVFSGPIKSLLPRIHAGAYEHRGKSPKRLS